MLPRRLEIVGEAREQQEPTADSVLDKSSWHEAVEAAIVEAQQSGTPLTVIFIDVNHFKDINDNLGHATGDEVIDKLREMLVSSLRTHASEMRPPEDLDLVSLTPARQPERLPRKLTKEFMPGHIGGDEFGVLCKTDESGARILIDRLRSSFNQMKSDPENKELSGLDISLAIGMSSLEPGWDSRKLLSEADLQMYRDKERQLEPLNDEQKEFLNRVAEGLEKYEIRIRDVGKYLVMLSKDRRLAE